MDGHTHRFPPLAAVQEQRLTEMIELVAAEYVQWLRAEALGQHTDEVARRRARYHNFRAAYELFRQARGLRRGDRVRVYSGPFKGLEGMVEAIRAGASLTIAWPDGSPLHGQSVRQPHAWQLELIEPVVQKETV